MEKNDAPKVTVVIPTLNVAKYISECLDSVCSQTLNEIEIFVVDANSTDGTREIVKEYISHDGRISLLNDDKKSTGYAKNLVIDVATAPFYAVVEPDDYVEHDMLENLYEAMIKYNADIVKCGYDTFMDSGERRIFFPKNVANGMKSYYKVLKPSDEVSAYKWVMYEWLGLYRVSFLRKFKIRHNETKGAAFQDIGFWFLGFAYAERVTLIKPIGYHYRIDNPNSSVNDIKKIFNTCVEYAYIKARLSTEKSLWNKVKGAFWREYFHSNMAAYRSLAYSLRDKLIGRMREEIEIAYNAGEIDDKYFDYKEKKLLYELMKSEDDFNRQYCAYLNAMQENIERLLQRVKDKRIIIFGAGFYGANIWYVLKENKVAIDAWADNDEHKQGTYLNNVIIKPPKQCVIEYPTAIWLVANYHIADEMKKELLSVYGVDEKNIVLCDAEGLKERLM